MEQGLAPAQPGELQRAASRQHHSHVGVDLGHRLQGADLVVRQGQVVPVQPLALKALGDAQKEEDRLCPAGQLRRLPLQALRGLAAPAVGLGVADDVQTALLQAVQGPVQPGGVDQGGTGPLIPGLQGQVPQHRDFGPGGQGEEAALIFQQHRALRRRPAGQGVVGPLVKVLGGGSGGFGGGQHHVQQLVHPPVDHVQGNLPPVQSLQHLPVAVPLGAGHF